ncbi:MAG: 4Fe-4S binding protein [Nitrososphaera sp.]|uniref:Putative ferredoxin n=1 Tax=Nitrososphaera gargensis (strain Ga9.2) TaxID=1237085 RepID=K0IJC9_NITGG|nr:4Fe-4S dicluster domain-containing protein [Candidatus Nitrososphaera gargensis]AFU59223.1 putative ferredoxin [Candidatus Nitrososphaera gargensis Ga9.2]
MTATVTEYVCEDCGTLLRHSNPNTLESMRDVHNQLCIVKRQKTMAAQAAVPKPAAAPAAPAAVSPTAAAPPPAIPAAPSAPAAGGPTTISLSGTGTNYGKVEGPIDPKFKEKRQQVGTYQGIKVWGPYDAPGQLGIWGDYVCIDFDICVADGACIEACPVNVYEWLQTPGHPASDKKAFMIREKDCIFCMACENVCPPQAVKIFKKS